MLLALTSSWLTRVPSPDRPGMDTLYLQQALTADAGGQTYLDVFRPARRVTYLFNHLLGVRTEFRRTEGEELAAFGLDTPTSSSLPLTCRASDKLLTTTMCAGKRPGVQVSVPGVQVYTPGVHAKCRR